MIGQGTKDYLVFGAGWATESAGGIILGVAVGIWAHLLEEVGVVRGAAVACHSPGTAVPILLEHRARAVTTPRRLQTGRALRRYVGSATRPLAAPWPALGRHRQVVHGHVEALDRGDVEEILAAEAAEPKLRDGVGRPAIGFAGEQAAAVARLAGPGAIAVEGAARVRPQARGVAVARVEGPGLAWVELHAATNRHSRRLYGVGAAIDDVNVVASLVAARRRRKRREGAVKRHPQLPFASWFLPAAADLDQRLSCKVARTMLHNARARCSRISRPDSLGKCPRDVPK